MKTMRLIIAFVLATPFSAQAMDFHFEGYGDGRVVFSPTVGDAYVDGGLGKLRYGEDDGHPGLYLADIVGSGSVQFNGALSATAVARINPRYSPAVDLVEAYVRYRPVSTSSWRWAVEAGAFFPPISLENDQLGWQSFWTITPSAINSWLGAEVRILGVQGSLEWRRNEATLAINAAIFGFNDAMGVLVADRGWNFDDHPLGLFTRYRLPNSLGAIIGTPPPLYADLFKEIDNRPGWYLDVSYEPQGGGIELMGYDNNADPTKVSGADIAWHTRFWNLGLYKQIDGLFTVMGQGMTGTTSIDPSPFFHSQTGFSSAYLLAGVDLDRWWLAVRGEVFSTHTENTFGYSALESETGRALTLAANYAPTTWMRWSGEYLLVNSRRGQRVLDGDPPHIEEHQLQLSLRIFF